MGKNMNVSEFIAKNYKLKLDESMPLEIPNVGRDDLAAWLKKLNFKTAVEVGVASGEYSEVLCRNNPDMKVIGVDPYTPYRGYRDYTSTTTLGKLKSDAVARLSKYKNYELIQEFSVDALRRFEDDSLDFVYIDANHRDPFVSEDINQWYKKIKPGGILAGHDYIRQKNNFCDVVAATNRFAMQNNIKTWYVLGTKEIVPGEVRDRYRSWVIVKPQMDATLEYIVKKFNVDLSQPSPIKISCNRYKDLPVLFRELGFKVGVEVGVLEGTYSEVLCQSNPDLKLFSVDPWLFYPVYKNFRKQRDHDRAYEIAKNKLAKYPNNKIIKTWSVEAAKDFADESLDFVYIDADHSFQAVTNDIAVWSKKVRKGGIIAGHDFSTSKNRQFGHVKNVVMAWCEAYAIHPLFELKNPPDYRENSWMYVKIK